MPRKKIAKKLGVGGSTVTKILKERGLEIPKELKEQWKREAILARHRKEHRKYRPGDSFLKKNYLTMPVKSMGTAIGKSYCYVNRRLDELGLVIPPEVVERNRQAGRIKPGNVPPNKGKKMDSWMNPAAMEASKKYRFKKGGLPHNTKEDGAISVRKDTGTGIKYKYIRVSKGKWELLQRVNWEKQNGPIPEGYIIVFKDGDQMNCEPENLEMITLAENMRRNSASEKLTDNYVIHTLAGKAFKDNKEYKAALAKNTELIETKRLLLRVKRTIKNKLNEKQQSD